MHLPAISKKNKEFLVIVLLLNAVAIGLYAFLFSEMKTKNERTVDVLNQIETETKKEQTQHAVKALVAETEPLRVRLQSYVVGKEDSVSFLELLERTGGDVGVSVSINSVEKIDLPGSSKLEQLQLTLTAKGTWSGVVRFLGLLEFLPYEAHVDPITVSKGESKGGPWLLTLSLTVLKEK